MHDDSEVFVDDRNAVEPFERVSEKAGSVSLTIAILGQLLRSLVHCC